MEEILASIRRIISEDDAPAPAPEAAPEPAPAPAAFAPEPAAAPAPAPMAAPEPQIAAAAAPEEDVFDLTQKVEPEPAPFPADDFEFSPRAEAPAPVLAPVPPSEPLVSQDKAEFAASHFGALHQRVLMPAEGRTLEDVVRELLRPLLKDWLDSHLPGIVEEAVKAEVERISRRRY
jgi:cell pole-organizing protein PopZ